MVVGVMKLKLRSAWVHSLKEKRMEVKSIVSKVKNRFNVSIAEVESQDVHQTIVIGISCTTTDRSQADRILDGVLNYIEDNFDSEMLDYEKEAIQI